MQSYRINTIKLSFEIFLTIFSCFQGFNTVHCKKKGSVILQKECDFYIKKERTENTDDRLCEYESFQCDEAANRSNYQLVVSKNDESDSGTKNRPIVNKKNVSGISSKCQPSASSNSQPNNSKSEEKIIMESMERILRENLVLIREMKRNYLGQMNKMRSELAEANAKILRLESLRNKSK